jgi:hypothetical protein
VLNEWLSRPRLASRVLALLTPSGPRCRPVLRLPAALTSRKAVVTGGRVPGGVGFPQQPTRSDLAKAALGIIFCSAVFTTLFVWVVSL